ncbi:MAG: TonB-dependent receptor [Paludibacter sp.]|nr:TonB-dependent receptor [Paludibacter sp.]
MNKILKLMLFLLIIPPALMAQKGTIKGRIYNAKTNEPVEFANIIIQGTNIGSTSDLDGNYIFTGIEPGFKQLVVSLIGFQTAVSPEIQVQGNQTVFIDIPVNETSLMLNEVVIKRNYNTKKIESPISVITLGVQEIEKSAGVNRDVSKLVQTLPGVAVTDPNRNDLIVRGGGPSENVFYLDGIEIPVINHFTTQGSSGGVVGIINPDFVQDISFYTGAFPANRTNALSSVMEIKQREGNKDKLQGKVSIGASDAALTLDGPIGEKSNFIISARQSYLQLLFQLIGLPFLPTYNDFQVKYRINFDKKNQLTLLSIGAIDDMVLNLNIKNPTEAQSYLLSYLPVYKQWNYTVGAVYKHFADSHYDTWILSRNMLRNSNFKFKNNDESLGKISDYTSDEIENKFRFEQNYPDGKVKFSWGAGATLSGYTNATSRLVYSGNDVKNLNYSTDISLLSYQAFAQASDEYLDNRLKLSLGINFVGNNYNKNMSNPLNQFSPRFSASYSLTDNINLNANFGRYALRPAYTTLGYKDINTGVLANQNENLRYTISNQAIAGIEFLKGNQLRLTVEGFYKQYQYYPFSVADGLSTASKGTGYGQVGDEEIVSTGKGRAYGVEFLLKIMEMKNLNVTATYTLFRSEFTNDKDEYIPSTWDTRQLLNLIASYKLPGNWNIAGRWRFSGGAPYSPIDQNLSELKAAWDITNQPYIDYANFNSLRLKPNHQLDIRIDKEFYFKKWLLNLYTDVQNVYNYQAESTPIWTNLGTDGQPVDKDAQRYQLRKIEAFAGTVLPTIGIIVKF